MSSTTKCVLSRVSGRVFYTKTSYFGVGQACQGKVVVRQGMKVLSPDIFAYSCSSTWPMIVSTFERRTLVPSTAEQPYLPLQMPRFALSTA